MELKTIDLCRSFPDFTFRADINAREGEFVCLLGPSGCGKTTALQLIAGILAPDGGEIYLGGRNITDLPPWKRNIGLVFQDYALFPHMNVHDNIAYGLRQQGMDAKTIRDRVDELLDLVQLPGYHKRKPHELSGGEKQRVALARAAAPSPALLLLDEPLSALDARLRIRLRREIRDIQQRIGLTTIYVTHDQEEALSLSDRIVMMENGRILQDGRPQELYRTPVSSTVARFIGNANLLPVSEIGRPDIDRLAESPAGSALAGAEPDQFLFFRPEDTSISHDTSDWEDELALEATVHSIEYIGSHYIIEGLRGAASLRAYLRSDDTEASAIESLKGKKCWFRTPQSKFRILEQ